MTTATQPEAQPGASSRRPAGARVAVVAVLAALVLGLGWFQGNRPDAVGTREVPGVLDEPVDAAGARIVVGAPHQADVVRVTNDFDTTTELTTPGTFLLVRVAYQGVSRPVGMKRVAFQAADGRVFYPDDRQPTPWILDAQVGQWWFTEVVLELPVDAVGDGLVVVMPESPTTGLPLEVAVVPVTDADIVREDGPVDVIEPQWVLEEEE
ncbi:MAG TPA: hypothetical protein DHV14_11850 [Micrococcales bacterium]|uniref:hypothetical protein n=1 Tax=Miniimonas arenae TaxID=676201 RepID=UPI000EBF841B|nr:hypothetical protein [Miniimonas arenae]HCX85805.1 hypothetical protein [Micrococcales bacterium]